MKTILSIGIIFFLLLMIWRHIIPIDFILTNFTANQENIIEGILVGGVVVFMSIYIFRLLNFKSIDK